MTVFVEVKGKVPHEIHQKFVILSDSQCLKNSDILSNALLCYFQHIEMLNNIKIEDLKSNCSIKLTDK